MQPCDGVGGPCVDKKKWLKMKKRKTIDGQCSQWCKVTYWNPCSATYSLKERSLVTRLPDDTKLFGILKISPKNCKTLKHEKKANQTLHVK